jgi:hypothetical protein
VIPRSAVDASDERPGSHAIVLIVTFKGNERLPGSVHRVRYLYVQASMRMYVRMRSDGSDSTTPDAPDATASGSAEEVTGALLRRRVVFELSAEQMPLLEKAERRHGSKRKALIAALAADAAAERVQEEASVLREELAQALGQIARLEAETAAATTPKTAPAEPQRTLREARKRITVLEAEWERMADAVEALDQISFDQLYCGDCGGWVGSDAWVIVEHDDGDLCVHEICAGGREQRDGAGWLGWRPRRG